MSQPILIQLGLFGGCTEIADMHTVAAHTRTLADGSEVFVGEHLRWNRGRQPERPSAPRPAPKVPEDHPSLFDWTPPDPDEAPSDPAEVPTDLDEAPTDPDEAPTETTEGPLASNEEPRVGQNQLGLGFTGR